MKMKHIAFNRIVLGEDERSDIRDRPTADELVRTLLRGDACRVSRGQLVEQGQLVARMVFMSHKTGDAAAENVARHISSTENVAVYMAEWDSNIPNPAYVGLPDYILRVIKASVGFLVHVIDEIRHSMWVGYEVGVAHAFNKPRARIMYNVSPKSPAPALPAVVSVLLPLDDCAQLSAWVIAHLPPPKRGGGVAGKKQAA